VRNSERFFLGEALPVKKDIGATLQYLSFDVLVLTGGAGLASCKFD